MVNVTDYKVNMNVSTLFINLKSLGIISLN